MARIVRLMVFVVLLGLLALPAFSEPEQPARPGNLLSGPSALAGYRYYLAHPDQAPDGLRGRFQAAHAIAAQAWAARGRAGNPRAPFGDLFNRDTVGLPQNETSISDCTSNPKVLLGGTNDYRGIIDPQGNFTGWHLSVDGGRTVANEGLLPPVQAAGQAIPSGGDPVFVTGKGCSLYGASLNYGSGALGETPSAVGVYRSDVDTATSCPQGDSDGGLTHPECWPTRRAVDVAGPGRFLDKEWMDVGRSGRAGEVVWIAYGDLGEFNEDGNEESGIVKAVRCRADLSACTAPITLSAGQRVAEYPSVTIAADGRTYITWGEFFGESFIGPAQRGWLAVAEPGSTSFTVRQAVPRDDLIMRGGIGTLHANDFRTGTQFKNTVKLVGGKPRIYVTWERCTARVQETICEEPKIMLTWSADQGRTWTTPRPISKRGDNYFPELDTDPATGAIVGAWYTNRFDPIFHNRQDVELVRLRNDGTVVGRQRVTKISNETEADPILGGAFIGDYLEVTANRGRAWVHYNANERHVALIGEGLPVPQQDNYLTRLHE
jgi:hypothetical protein